MRDWCCGRSILLTASITGFEVWRRVRASDSSSGSKPALPSTRKSTASASEIADRACCWTAPVRGPLRPLRRSPAVSTINTRRAPTSISAAIRSRVMPGTSSTSARRCARKAIEEGRFPDVRAADNGDDREVETVLRHRGGLERAMSAPPQDIACDRRRAIRATEHGFLRSFRTSIS